MREYELTVLIKPDLTEKELDKEVKLLADFLEKNGAKIKSKKDPEKKSTAYPVAKFREAWYVFMELSLDSQTLVGIEEKIRVSDNVLRHLLCRQNP